MDMLSIMTVLRGKDDKPTAVCQCLGALKEVVLYRPELKNAISRELDALELSKYKDSMLPLILRDISELKKLL